MAYAVVGFRRVCSPLGHTHSLCMAQTEEVDEFFFRRGARRLTLPSEAAAHSDVASVSSLDHIIQSAHLGNYRW